MRHACFTLDAFTLDVLRMLYLPKCAYSRCVTNALDVFTLDARYVYSRCVTLLAQDICIVVAGYMVLYSRSSSGYSRCVTHAVLYLLRRVRCTNLISRS
jgi:hypothetical protein